MNKIQKGIILFSASMLVVFLAYYLGNYVSQVSYEKKTLANRNNAKQQLLDRIPELKPGNDLPDYLFENLSFEPIKLSEAINFDSTILLFIEPNCSACHENIDLILANLENKEQQNRFVIISAGNPRYLIDLKAQYDLKMNILYDHERVFTSMLGINQFPFHIIAEKNLQIIDIIASPLIESDILKVI